MEPLLLPFFERRVRKSLVSRGVTARELSTRAGTIHVYDAPGKGTLPTIVILHGIAGSGTGFANLFMRLRKDAKRVIVPDYPGHGLSADPSVRLTIDALFDAMTGALDELLGDEPFVIVGNSLGGVVALEYAVKRKERCRAIVLLSPAGAASTLEEWKELMAAFGARTRRESLQFMARLYHRIPFVGHLVAHELPANVRRRGVADIFGSVSYETTVPPDELAALSMPILLWWGQSERLLPGSHLAWWKSHLPPQAVVEQPVGAGHCPHLDTPDRLAERIVSFLRQS